MSGEGHESGDICFHSVVDRLVFSGGDFKILFQLRPFSPTSRLVANMIATHLEQILLIIECLLFLVAQLCERVVESIVIYQLRTRDVCERVTLGGEERTAQTAPCDPSW